MVNFHKDSTQNSSYKRLHISENNKMFLGVLGGLAEYLNIDPTFLRLIFIVLVVLTGFFPGVVLYFIAAVIMPKA